MNEWKELKIDDLPSDILTGKYEMGNIIDSKICVNMTTPIGILNHMLKTGEVHYYRKQPRHRAGKI